MQRLAHRQDAGDVVAGMVAGPDVVEIGVSHHRAVGKSRELWRRRQSVPEHTGFQIAPHHPREPGTDSRRLRFESADQARD